MEERLGRDGSREQTKVIHRTHQALGRKELWGCPLGLLGAKRLPRAPRGRRAQSECLAKRGMRENRRTQRLTGS